MASWISFSHIPNLKFYYLCAQMKKLIQSLLQKILGFQRYLFWFSVFKIKTLHWDNREGDFMHFLSLIPEDGKVLDIGANIGIMTAHLAQRCAKGEVHGFEPIPENYVALKKICAYYAFQNVTLHDFALGEEAGELTMVMPEVEAVRMQGLSHVVHETITEFNEGLTYSVPVKPLDELEFVMKDQVHAIKIDVENFEQFVFRGARNLLNTHHPIVYCELWDNENRTACFRLFQEELGYAIQVLQKGVLVDFDVTKHQNQNFFFMPPPHK